MNVSLTPQLEKFVQEKVESGRYSTASEVVREGLRLMEERDHLRTIKLEELRQSIREADEQIDQGLGLPGSEVINRLRAKYEAIAIEAGE